MRLLWVSLLLASLASAQTPAAPPSVPDWVQVDPNQSYAQFKETVVDVYYPKQPASAKRPAVLAIHGGGWVGGTKERVFDRLVLPYLEKGFVVANVEYRLAKAAKAPAAVTDVLTAAEWLRSNARKYNVDPRRIVVTGDSAGGHLSLMVGLTPKSAKLGPAGRVAAIVNFYGITDVEDQLQGPNMRDYAVTWVPEGPSRAEIARSVSPITYVRKDVPPTLTIHGAADETVPYEHGVHITRLLRDAGADAELISIPDGKHGFPPDQMKKIYTQIFDFLKKRGISQQ